MTIHQSSWRNSQSRCIAVVIHNCNDVCPIIVDVDVETVLRITLESCTCGIGADGRQRCCRNVDDPIAIKVLVEISLVLGDATPRRVRPIKYVPELLME